MSVAFDHRDPGTPEALWEAAEPWERAPALELDMRRLVVIAAHPDDETLGAGGLIATAAARGVDVSVLVMTDGEASHPQTMSGHDLRRERRAEVLEALAQLAPGCSAHFAGLPDGGLRERRDEVRRAVRNLLSGEDPETTTIVTTWVGDGHRDHRILAEVVSEEVGGRFDLLEFPVWLWHWGTPDDVDTADWSVLSLDPAARTKKAAAVRCYLSQTVALSDAAGDEPILHAGMLRHFERPVEVFVRAGRRVQDSVDPSWFEARYARRRDPWRVDTRWYEERKRAVLVATLPRVRYRRLLEIGCGTGALTAELAARADEIVALDVSATAVAEARQRVADIPRIQVIEADARVGLPDESFDAIVLSEVAYYWNAEDLGRVLVHVESSLTEDGVLVACHWRHPIADAPMSGDDVHRVLSDRDALAPLIHHREDDFVLDVFGRPGGVRSVARETGVIT